MDKHSTESLLKQRQYGKEEFLLHLYLFKPVYSYHARSDRQVLCMSIQSPKNLTYAREAVIIIWIYMQHFFGEHGKQSAILAPARGARRPPWSPSTVFF